MKTLAIAAVLAAGTFVALPALAQEQSGSGAPNAELPNVATEIVVEDLAVSVKRLRFSIALSPEQLEGLTKALEGTGATISTGGSSEAGDAASASGNTSDD